MVDSWEVSWTEPTGAARSREFSDFLAAWTFNEEMLKGKGEVVLLTDRPLLTDRHARTEAEEARRREGGRRWSRKSKPPSVKEER